jgi:hypothetical protein
MLGDPVAVINPVANSVRLAAETAVGAAKPSEAELAALREAFIPYLIRLRLEDRRFVRQPAALAALPWESRRLIRALTDARLLTTRIRDGAAIVEVAHEALFTAWPTLAAWIDDEQLFLADVERVKVAYQAWAGAPEQDRPRGLLQGMLLANARNWLVRYPQRFLGPEMQALHSFITVSAEVADVEITNRQKRQLYHDLLNRSLHEYVVPYLKEERLKVESEMNKYTSRSFETSYREFSNKLHVLDSFIIQAGRWHPRPAECIKTLGADDDYIDIFEFPCCGTQVRGDQVLAYPSQFSYDGCEEAPHWE